MKKLSLLFGSMFLMGVASAAPFVAYSGQAKWVATQSGRSVTKTLDIYLLADLANPDSYGVLQYDDSTGQGEINIFPLTSPTQLESDLEFFTEDTGTASLSIADITTDSSSNSDVTQFYATGHLLNSNTILAAARNVVTSSLSHSGDIVMFPPSQAVYSGSHPFASQLTGTTASYTVSSTGSITETGKPGSFALALSSSLTAAANVGGGFAVVTPGPTFVNAQTATALNPVINPHQTLTSAQADTQWLTNLAAILHVSLAPSSSSSTGTTTPGTTGSNLGGLGGYAGGVSLSTGGGGNLLLNGGSNSYSGGATLSGVGTVTLGGGTGILTISGTGGSTTSTGSLTYTGPTTITGGTITTSTLTSGTGSLTFTLNPGSLTGTGSTLSATLSIPSGTISITSLNGSLVSGTIVTAPPNSTISFSNVALILNGTANPAGITVGDSYTGSGTLSGGTYGLGTYSSGTLTITSPTLNITNP